jgi:hypothetical protein
MIRLRDDMADMLDTVTLADPITLVPPFDEAAQA